MNRLTQKLEALLFYLAEPVSVSELAGMLKVDTSSIEDALRELETALEGHGVQLLKNADTVCLVTAPEASDEIRAIVKEEMTKDLSKASLETLSIVLYKGPITRSEIDHIRGVNSTFILRNLMVRGLVEKIDNPKDQRSFLYRPTNALLEHLGVTSIDRLPKYQESKDILEGFMQGAANVGTPGTEERSMNAQEGGEEDITEDIDLTGENFEDKELLEHNRRDD